MGEPDYYQILGVSREADLDDIKLAYHRLAARYHPDLHPEDPDAEARLRSLNQAYATLRDPERRAQYDRWGPWGPPPWAPPQATPSRAWIAAAIQHLLHVHGQVQAHKPQRGQDQRYTLSIAPQNGRRGTEARLRVPTSRWCPQCSGSRMAGGKAPYQCPQCRGAREIWQPTWLLPALRVCKVCQGEGVVITDPCAHCAGRGTVRVVRTLTIDIPPGVHNGARLRLRGEGEPGRWGGEPGDLLVEIRIRPELDRTPPTPP
ncbi:MAG TPA: J domain-containing protein [Alphaproteobacteria bacterium]|nr:J domain-containing protein [Alphaproteobacteria bacterium]